MRALVVLVSVEFLALIALGAVWLCGERAPRTQSTPITATRAPVTPPAPPVPQSETAAAAPARERTPPERRAAPAPAALAAAGDPIGILVSGSIRSTDGAPVDGASIAFRRPGTYRLGNGAGPGTYAACGLQPGEWTLACSADGFAPYEAACTLDARARQCVDIELRPAYAMLVRVQDASGKPIMEELAQRSPFSLPYVVATDDPLAADLPCTEQSRLTRFGLGDWMGAYEPGARAPGLRERGYCGELRLLRAPPVHVALMLRTTLLQSQAIEAGQKEITFTISLADVLAKLGKVRLRLLDAASGQPLADARVSLEMAQGGGSAGKSGADGGVTLDHVPPGLCRLEVRARETEHLSRCVRVPAGGTLDLGDVTLGAALQLQGTVVDAAGKPAAGASVQWTDLDGRTFPQPLTERRSAGVDADGHFALPGCGRHRYALSARGRDGAVGFASVDATSGVPPAVTITLGEPTHVALRADFPATTGYVVTVLAADGVPVAVATLTYDVSPNALALPPGRYTVQIHELGTDRLVRRAPLQVGVQPLTLDVP